MKYIFNRKWIEGSDQGGKEEKGDMKKSDNLDWRKPTIARIPNTVGPLTRRMILNGIRLDNILPDPGEGKWTPLINAAWLFSNRIDHDFTLLGDIDHLLSEAQGGARRAVGMEVIMLLALGFTFRRVNADDPINALGVLARPATPSPLPPIHRLIMDASLNLRLPTDRDWLPKADFNAFWSVSGRLQLYVAFLESCLQNPRPLRAPASSLAGVTRPEVEIRSIAAVSPGSSSSSGSIPPGFDIRLTHPTPPVVRNRFANLPPPGFE